MLKVVYSNDMMQLAGALADTQQSEPLPPFAEEAVLVQSNELARWLSLYFASQHGIAAHIDFPFPSAYIWRLFRNMCPDVPRESAYATDAMTWRLFQLLPECVGQSGFEAITNYLGDDADVLKRFRLAHRVADSFDQYLMYRPDWVQQWEQGDTPHWQGRLWHQLTQADETPMHRANLLQQMHDLLAQAETKPDFLPERLSIIGITAMPPVYLNLFELMARFCDVTLYFLSPSQEYWGDLRDKKQQAKQLSLLDAAEDLLTEGHPLLASLGKQGQEFFEQLQSCQHEAFDLFITPEPQSLLGLLQYDIFTLTDIDNDPLKHVISAEDKSVQVHSCHSAMREVEVLHDQLLAMLAADDELTPTDIVVMTPDIEQYAPAIDAVFASVAEAHKIPYSIADCSVRYQSPLINTFLLLLDLPQSRFDVEWVMSILETPAAALRFGLDEEAISTIRGWLKGTYTRWGLSAEDKSRFDVPTSAANTWRAGLDQLLLAYAMPQANQPGSLFENHLAYTELSGERASNMAKLCAFIDTLDRCRQQLAGDKSAEQWQQMLNQLLDDLFQTNNGSSDQEQNELTHIRQTIAQFVSSTEQAAFNDALPLTLVKEWLNRHLDSQASQSRFMGHGVTFCGMVPMRSIPFKVVCLIGMNDDSYPRRQPKLGFDLLANDFRIGDRSRRDDDRYLFLEAILSAKSTLYISYVGASIHDNATIPPSVLVSDLRDVLNLSCQTENGEPVWTQLFTEHPLQAFSRRYFDKSDEKLFSYQQSNCPEPATVTTQTWFSETLPEADDGWRQLSLTQLIQFYRHPARYLMNQRLGIKLELSDEQLETREPFQLDGLEAWQLRQQLFDAKLSKASTAELQAYVEASGVLPQGHIGEQVFAAQDDIVSQFVDKLLPDLPEQFEEALSFDLKLEDFHLNGQLQSLSSQGLFFFRMAKTKGADILAAWLNHLVLNCVKPAAIATETTLITQDGHYQFNRVENAQQLLLQYLQWYWQGCHQPLPLFNNTSFAFAKATLNEGKASPDNAMWSNWLGSQYQSAEADDLYHQQLFAETPLDDDFKSLAIAVYEPIKAHLREGKL